MKSITTAILVLCVSATAAMAQDKADSANGFPEGWREVPVAVRAAYTVRKANALLGVLSGGEVKQSFEKYANHYPLKDDGMLVSAATRPGGTEERITIGVRLVGVWIGSPADKIGLVPGDWILSIEGKPVCGDSSFKTLSGAEAAEIGDVVAEYCSTHAIGLANRAPGEDFAVEVERDGKSVTYKVGRANVGQAVKDFMLQNMPAWEAVWTASAKELEELGKELEAAGEDEKKVDACFLKFSTIKENVSQAGVQVTEFEKKQQRRLQEEKK